MFLYIYFRAAVMPQKQGKNQPFMFLYIYFRAAISL